MSDREDSRSRSRSRSRSYSRKRRSYSRSRSRDRRSRSRSRRRSYSRSRSRSRDRGNRGYRGHRNGGFNRDRSHSPMSSRRRHRGNREDPDPNRCIGVFGLSLHTKEREVEDIFSKYGRIENCQLVMDRHSGRSRGFAFVHYENIEDAIEAKEAATGSDIDGKPIRVDYSVTERAHTPTPGVYLGNPSDERGRGGRRGGYRGGGGGYGGGGSYYNSRRSPSPYYRRRRSPSPYRRRYSRSRSRSYSPRRY